MNKFTFNISLSILNHLGRNLYRNFITVLGEAISNSWDADAKNVWISIDKENNSLTIKDDGIGMNSKDFQTKFLKIGYSKRKNKINRTNANRPFIGRKGIGKLALLSCAEKIHLVSKTTNTKFIGGIIDNNGLNKAIDHNLTPKEYSLKDVDLSLFDSLGNNLNQGTIIHFENINDGIRNSIPLLRKLIALYFRFSLIDKSFNLILNDEPITLDELNNLAQDTQFVWQINTLDDPYLKEKISAKNDYIKKYSDINSKLSINGFIASSIKPSSLKIRGANETVTVDLYVNGRLREKDILKHIPSTKIVESYLYGQIHYNNLDGENDIFKSSREGIISDDPLFQEFLKELEDNILKQIIDDWDKFRIALNQDGDPENNRMQKEERKSKELSDAIINGFTPSENSPNKKMINRWLNSLRKDSQFNLSSYAECFISENLLRKYIEEHNKDFSNLNDKIEEYKKREERACNEGNINIKIRKDNDLNYLSMIHLAYTIDPSKDNSTKQSSLVRDAKSYKPIRDAIAHTSRLTKDAKDSLNVTYKNIKSRIKKLLDI